MKFRNVITNRLSLQVLLILCTILQTHVAAVPTHQRRQINNNTDITSTTSTTNITNNTSSPRFENPWVSDPATRGTLTLVFSCVITLFLCVWTTVHVNIEPENAVNPILSEILPIAGLKNNVRLSRFLASSWIRKLGWGCLTIVVPEGAMAVAAYERKTAKLFMNKVNELIIPKKGEADQWDMLLAYYAVMGGFAIREEDFDLANRSPGEKIGNQVANDAVGDVAGGSQEASGTITTTVKPTATTEEKGGEEEQRPVKNKTLTLTPFGVLKLAEWDLLPPIRSAEVKDKSNANSLAKAIVFWQALWMIIQVIGRTATRLPVTLLELHTVLHTFCAVVMYITWWYKPVDIDLPTEVRLDRAHIELLIQGTSDPDPTNPLIPPSTKRTPATTPTTAPTTAPTPTIKEHPPSTTNDTSSIHTTSSSSSDFTPTNSARHAYLTSRAGLGKYMYQQLCGYDTPQRQGYFHVLSSAYTRLWRGRHHIQWEGLGISLAGLIYGGVHLAAWNNPFPSRAEKRLWQISSTVTAIAWSGFVISLWVCVVIERVSAMVEKNRARTRGKLRRGMGWLCGVMFGVGLFPCLFVRLFLLVESFAELRRLPMGSYKLTSWANSIPHAG